MDKELDRYLTLFTNVNNPDFYALLLVILLQFLTIITSHQILIPCKLAYELEKKGMELKTKVLELEKNKLESAKRECTIFLFKLPFTG